MLVSKALWMLCSPFNTRITCFGVHNFRGMMEVMRYFFFFVNIPSPPSFAPWCYRSLTNKKRKYRIDCKTVLISCLKPKNVDHKLIFGVLILTHMLDETGEHRKVLCGSYGRNSYFNWKNLCFPSNGHD